MSLDLIKAQLLSVEQGITGVKGASFLIRNAPQAPELPFILNVPALPFPTWTYASIAELFIEWNFDICLLFKPSGLGTVEDWDSGMEPYPVRIASALLGHLTLNQTCADQALRGNPRIDYKFSYLEADYVALIVPWTIRELQPITIAA